MEPRLVRHHATHNLAGNHFNRSDILSRQRLGDGRPSWDMAARLEAAERILNTRIAHARYAARHLAVDALHTYQTLQAIEQAEFRLMLSASNSAWLRKQFDKFQVHHKLRDLATEQFHNEILVRGLV